ncbi:hypothetical protein EDB89DRAFT_1917677 [Lactarius sanguifluus]|nr:hypothetical protein EDB89DRAFT_1917677 [Lactarius sanguifluus]
MIPKHGILALASHSWLQTVLQTGRETRGNLRECEVIQSIHTHHCCLRQLSESANRNVAKPVEHVRTNKTETYMPLKGRVQKLSGESKTRPKAERGTHGRYCHLVLRQNESANRGAQYCSADRMTNMQLRNHEIPEFLLLKSQIKTSVKDSDSAILIEKECQHDINGNQYNLVIQSSRAQVSLSAIPIVLPIVESIISTRQGAFLPSVDFQEYNSYKEFEVIVDVVTVQVTITVVLGDLLPTPLALLHVVNGLADGPFLVDVQALGYPHRHVIVVVAHPVCDLRERPRYGEPDRGAWHDSHDLLVKISWCESSIEGCEIGQGKGWQEKNAKRDGARQQLEGDRGWHRRVSTVNVLYGAESESVQERVGQVRSVRGGESQCDRERTRAGANGDGENMKRERGAEMSPSEAARRGETTTFKCKGKWVAWGNQLREREGETIGVETSETKERRGRGDRRGRRVLTASKEWVLRWVMQRRRGVENKDDTRGGNAQPGYEGRTSCKANMWAAAVHGRRK